MILNVHLLSMNNNAVLHNLGSIVLCLMSAEKQTPHLLVIVSGGLMTTKPGHRYLHHIQART